MQFAAFLIKKIDFYVPRLQLYLRLATVWHAIRARISKFKRLEPIFLVRKIDFYVPRLRLYLRLATAWRILKAYKARVFKFLCLFWGYCNPGYCFRFLQSRLDGNRFSWCIVKGDEEPHIFSPIQIKLLSNQKVDGLFLINVINGERVEIDLDAQPGTHITEVLAQKYGAYRVGVKIQSRGRKSEVIGFKVLWMDGLYYSVEGFHTHELLRGQSFHLTGSCFVAGQKLKALHAEVVNMENGLRFSQQMHYGISRPNVLDRVKYPQAATCGFEGSISIGNEGTYRARLMYFLYDGQIRYSRDLHEFKVSKKVILQSPYPKFSIITILYNKSKEVEFFIRSIFRQEYEGEIEIVFIDDASPDNSVGQAEKIFAECLAQSGKKNSITYKIIKNNENKGNCHSRNRGISEASGDYIIIIDADCMLNKEFLFMHAEAYAYGDADVIIGSCNLETEKRDPMEYLEYCEHHSRNVTSKSELQDSTNHGSFVNCVTRNFSISADFIRRGDHLLPLFDEDFSYSKDQKSGFGWEDTEMGYRLYQNAVNIKYVEACFTIHVSHPSSVSENTKPLKSMKNFARLHRKYPELKHIARRWTIETYKKISDWVDRYDLPIGSDQQFLEREFGYLASAPYFIKKDRPRRVLTYRWHVPHQYELYKTGFEFHLVKGLGTGFTNEWQYDQRPMPSNARFVSWEESQKYDYDFALLHFDENVLNYDNCNGVIGSEWGANFQFFMENVRLPKVAICHGTPQFYGQYNAQVNPQKLMQVIEESRKALVDYVGEMQIVCNSYQAEKEWGFKKSKVIWQGFDPTEFPLSTYQKGVLTMGNAMKERPHYRGYILYEKVINDLFPKEWTPCGPRVKNPSPNYEKNSNGYAHAKYRNYIDNIREHSIYFNPTLRSPMPRSRGEAMMCGLATVSANNHDVEMFVKNGVNGFYSNDPDELREYLLYLLKNPDIVRKIGNEARATSMNFFNHDRYLQSWIHTIRDLVGK